MQTIDGQKIEIHNHKMLKAPLSPWKAEMVKLFYGNNANRVITYHWVYERPEEEKLNEWHAVMEAERIRTDSMTSTLR